MGLILGLLVTLVALPTQAQQREGISNPPLSILISTPQQMVKVGSKVVVNISLANISGRTLKMGGLAEYPSPHIYSINLLDEKGELPLRTVTGRINIDEGIIVGTPDDFGRDFAPDEIVNQTIELTTFFQLGLGKYTLHLERGLGNRTIRSNTITFSVSASLPDSQVAVKWGGRILDQTNAGIPASVRLVTPDRLIETKADPDGHFEFSGLVPGTYFLEVLAPGFKPDVIDKIYVGEQQTEMTFSLTLSIGTASPPCVPAWHQGIPIGPTISYDSRSDDSNVVGTIYDNGSGQPLANVTVYLSRSDRDPQVTTTSDEKGEFRLSSVEPGRYSLTVFHKGYWIYPPQYPGWVTRQNVTKFLLLMEPQNICH